MNGQTHHLPGRLRLRFSELKHDPVRRARVTSTLRDIDGIISVDASAVTGGMLIYYDASKGNTRPFWDAIEAALSVHRLQQDLYPSRQARRASALTHQIADGVAGALVEKVVKRSAFALVAALF